MAKQLFVKLQTPTVEVKVEAKPDASGETSSILVGFKRYSIDKVDKILEDFRAAAETDESGIAFIQEQVVYIKNASIDIYEDAVFLETMNIDDTRSATPFAPFWESGKEALAVLSSYYLNSAPWKGQFTDAFVKALINLDYKEAEVKN